MPTVYRNFKRFSNSDRIGSVAKRWRQQYPQNRLLSCGESSNSIAEKLETLNSKTATAQDVYDIIGNETWTTTICNNCNKYVEDAVEFDYQGFEEDDTLVFCKKCLQKALALMD